MSCRFLLGKAAIDRIDFNGAITQILRFAQQSPCRFVVTPNSDHLVLLEHDTDLQKVYASAALVVADGMPLVWASRLLGLALPERVTGSAMLPRLCAEAAQLDLRVYLLGGPPGVAEQAQKRLQAQYPRLNICGLDCPPYGFEKNPTEEQAVLAKIKAAKPQIVFVALGAPKQELWMQRSAAELPQGVLLGVGAALEFCAGTVKRAPHWMQELGMEWLYRLSQEPKRLLPRYLRDCRIFWIIIRQWRQERLKSWVTS